MTRHKITVAELQPPGRELTATEVATHLHAGPTVVFEQTFDDLNLRAFVRQLNAGPKRRKKAESK